MKRENKKQVFTIIIPAFNEERTISSILEKIKAVILPYEVSKEIIVIDDCSTDGTAGKVNEFKKKNPGIQLKYVKNEKNKGKGYSVRRGIELAGGEIIIIQDADLEYNPDDYLILLPYILSGEYKVVYGSRLLNNGNKYSYRSFYWGGRLISWVASFLFSQRITDEPTCYKMFDASLLKSIPLTTDGFGFCPEITAKVLNKGYKIKEVPIRYSPRTVKEGKKIRWKDGIDALCILFYHRFFYKLTYAPVMANVIASLIMFFIIWGCYKNVQSYTWVHDSLLMGNYKVAMQNKHLSADVRREMKLGFAFRYLMFLKENTPEDAVIWMPGEKAYMPEGEQSPFRGEMKNKLFRIRVLHPRKLVDADETGNKYENQITHVAIVNGRGYEKLTYEPEEKTPFAIYTLKNNAN